MPRPSPRRSPDDGDVPEGSLLYDQTHISPVLLFVCAVIGVLSLFLSYVTGDPNPTVYILAVGLDFLILITFYSCRVTVDIEMVTLTYGIGFVKRQFDRHSATKFHISPNQLPTAWIYRPFAENSLLVTLREGWPVAIPTPYARQLSDVIDVSGRRAP